MTLLQALRAIGAITISEEAISGTPALAPIRLNAHTEFAESLQMVAAASPGGGTENQVRISISAEALRQLTDLSMAARLTPTAVLGLGLQLVEIAVHANQDGGHIFVQDKDGKTQAIVTPSGDASD
jgi:hypothetical protein